MTNLLMRNIPSRPLTVALWAMLSMAVLSACQDDSDCSTINSTTLLVSFLDSASGDALLQVYDSIYTSSGSILFNDTLERSLVELPIDPFNSTAQYFFAQDSVVDSLTVTYFARSRIISPSCGPEQSVINLALDSIGTSFDSAVVVSDILITLNETNIQLYIPN